MQKGRFILYTTHCPMCSVLKSKLQSKNISFQEIDDVDEMMKLGIESVPVLKIGEKLLNFSEAVSYVNSL